MARNLLSKNFKVIVYDTLPNNMKSLEKSGWLENCFVIINTILSPYSTKNSYFVT